MADCLDQLDAAYRDLGEGQSGNADVTNPATLFHKPAANALKTKGLRK
jgi:hypothetical protein